MEEQKCHCHHLPLWRQGDRGGFLSDSHRTCHTHTSEFRPQRFFCHVIQRTIVQVLSWEKFSAKSGDSPTNTILRLVEILPSIGHRLGDNTIANPIDSMADNMQLG